jgi:hypothetical protein
MTTDPPPPRRVLAWVRMSWTKAQGPSWPCARCDRQVRHGIVRDGTQRLLGTRKFRILCEGTLAHPGCYEIVMSLQPGMDEAEEKALTTTVALDDPRRDW